MKKDYGHDVETTCITAERQYDRMKVRLDQGIIDREEIVRAMDALNLAHLAAIKENKRHLIR
jgi:hypothetical protein